jgi:acid phosphatase
MPTNAVAGQSVVLIPSARAVTSNLFYTEGGEAGSIALGMDSTVSSARTSVSVTAPSSKYIDSWGWIALHPPASWAAANYTAALNVTRPNTNLRIVAVKVYRVNQTNGGVPYRGMSLVGAATGLSVSLGTAGVKTFTVTGAAQQSVSGDKLAVKFYTANASSSPQTFSYDAGSGSQSAFRVGAGGSATPTPIASSTPGTVSPVSHVTIVVMENDKYESIIGSPSAPYTNSLASHNALFTNSHGVSHPSEPNYLALFSGSTQNVTSDYCPYTFSGANLASELRAKGLTFTGYAEDLPSNGACQAVATSLPSHYLYQRKHVPWVDFSNVPAASSRRYTGPMSSYGSSVTMIVPDVCNDMHDCSIATGDAWLAKNVPAILAYDRSHNGILVLTWDEGDYSTTNHIVTIVAGPMVHAGRYSQSITHYDLLHSIERNFGLSMMGQTARVSGLPATVMP